MKFSINLVTWNGKKYLPYCLESVNKQTFRDFSLLILDNGSTDGTIEYLKEAKFDIPNVQIVYNEKNVGFAGGHNQAIKITDSEYVLMLNQDIILEPDFLEKVVNFLDKNQSAGAVTGKLMRWDFANNKKTNFLDSAGLQIFKNHRVIELGAGEVDGEKWNHVVEVFGVSGASPIFRRKALEKAMVDGQIFDEDFFSYKEDVDLAYRLRLLGWRAWFLPEARAYHDRTAKPSGERDTEVVEQRKNKSAFINYHSYKNHFFFLIKNLTRSIIFRYWSRILFYELKKFVYLVIFERETLKGLKEVWEKFSKMKERRKIVMTRSRASVWTIAKWFNAPMQQYDNTESFQSMDLSIVIVNFKTKGLLRECLREIKTVQPKLNYEIIVVDNGSRDGSAEMVKEEFPEVHLIISESNLGYAKGNNLGIKEARGRYVMIMNADIIMFSGTLEKLVEFMNSQSDVGIVAPKFLNPDKTLQYSCYHFPNIFIPVYRRTPLGELDFAKKAVDDYFMKDFNHNEIKEVDWLLGGCLLIRRTALDDVGLLDERYFAWFDDVDLGRSMWENKWKVVYYPLVSVIHFHRRESVSSHWWNGIFKKTTRIHIKSWIKYFIKWGIGHEQCR